MADVEEIIDYIKSLKKGFDKDLFQNKIDELAYAIDNVGLDYDDFHTLFKVWLNLSIPITKWVSLGTCLVPKEHVEERTVDYAFRWLLANCDNHNNFSRMAFLLDWLTAAMDSGSIDMVALDAGYELFFTMLSVELLTAHTVKLIYTLTKPSDVTRRSVLELLDYAKKREGKKDMLRQIQVLLGLFKSYRPECLPEHVPAISVHTTFKKINTTLVSRFRRSRDKRNSTSNEKQHLIWMNPLNSDARKKAEPLVPDMEIVHIGSKHYAARAPQKTYLDFSEPASLVQYSVSVGVSRPGRLRALLCNETGVALACLAPRHERAFLQHDIYTLLTAYFLESSPHSSAEKRDFLRRVGSLQRTRARGCPLGTRFLAQYLPLWCEAHYFHEILELVEYVSASSPDHVAYILDCMARVYHRAQPIEQCAILKSLTAMYTNMVFASTRPDHFDSSESCDSYAEVLPHVARRIADMCNKELQVDPEDLRVLYSCVRSAEAMSRAELRYGLPISTLPRTLTLSLPLLTPSALLVDKMAGLMLMYKKIYSTLKSTNKLHKAGPYVEQRKILEAYTTDLLSSLFDERVLANSNVGYVFHKLNPQVVSKLKELIPNADGKLSIRNGLAFAPYSLSIPLDGIDPCDATKRMYFDIVGPVFPHLSQLLAKAFPELRQYD